MHVAMKNQQQLRVFYNFFSSDKAMKFVTNFSARDGIQTRYKARESARLIYG